MDILNILATNQQSRVYSERNFFEEDESNFRQRYRVSHASFEDLVRRLEAHLKYKTKRSHSLSVQEQILTALHFYATNSVYHVLRDSHGPHESTVCRTVQRVTAAINDNLFQELVKWPTNSAASTQKFYEIGMTLIYFFFLWKIYLQLFQLKCHRSVR